jgi:hypothetical protein
VEAIFVGVPTSPWSVPGTAVNHITMDIDVAHHKRAAEVVAGDVPAAKRPRPEMANHDQGFGFESQTLMMDEGSVGDWGGVCARQQEQRRQQQQQQQQQHQQQQHQIQQQTISYEFEAGQSQWAYLESAVYEQADLMCMLPGMANNRYVCDPLGR